MESAAERRFFAAFHAALTRPDGPLTVLYSGGLDSSLVASCAREIGREVRLLVVGTRTAPDLVTAREGAAVLGMSLQERELSGEEIRGALQEPTMELRGTPEPQRSVRLAFDLALRATPPGPVACGQGADELFGGYARYRGRPVVEAELLRSGDLQRLVDVEWPWALRRAAFHGRSLEAPFLDPAVREIVLTAPSAETLEGTPPKRWLREAARRHGLAATLSDRPKRALQYGSRVRHALGSDTAPRHP